MRQRLKQDRRQILVALGIIRDHEGHILVSKRNDPHNRGMHGRWEFPGGKVEHGETPRQTAVREVREEVGIAAHIERVVDVFSWYHPDRPHIQIVLVVYLMTTETPRLARPMCNEVSNVMWTTFDSAMRLNVLPHNRTILRAAKKCV